MDVRPLRTEADYDWALKEIGDFFDREPEPGTPQADRFDVLCALVDAYEAQHWPIEAPDAVDAILQAIEEHRFARSDLVRVIGSRSKTAEILGRKRAISMATARRLHFELQVPADILIKPYPLQP